MRLKPSKCEFHQTETEYLGFIISQEGIKVDPVKTKAVRTWAKPTLKKEIQSFLGFCNFYRRFIEGFSKIAKPLYQLTEKDKKWEFREKQQKAFENLIHKLTHAPILAHYDPKKAVIIETDVSKYVTAVLGMPRLWYIPTDLYEAHRPSTEEMRPYLITHNLRGLAYKMIATYSRLNRVCARVTAIDSNIITILLHDKSFRRR